MTDAPGWVTLSDDETVVWSGRRTLWASADHLLLGIAAVAVGVALPLVDPIVVGPATVTFPVVPAALTGLAVGALLAGRALADWISVRYLLTTEEVYVKRGLVARTVRNLRLGQVQNTSFSQGVLGRVLSFGQVRFDTAGGEGAEVVFQNVPDPEAVLGEATRLQDDAVTAP